MANKTNRRFLLSGIVRGQDKNGKFKWMRRYWDKTRQTFVTVDSPHNQKQER
jgi:hypothetical protein